MIRSHEKLRIPDENKANDLVMEVNWNPKDPKTNECKVIRFIFPDGAEAYIKRDYLLAAIFAIGKEDDQRNLIPKKIETIRKYKTLLGITATKDIKKGEKINVEVDIPLPPIEQEIIGEAQRQLTKGITKSIPIT